MQRILNTIVNISIYLFNFFLGLKYNIKRFILKIQHKQELVIEDLYFINTKTNEVLHINYYYLDNLNLLLRYSNFVPIQNILNSITTNDINNYLLEFKYKKNNKKYTINFALKDNIQKLSFPIYHQNDMKHINMNKIVDIDDDNDLLELLSRYGGPLNDFYISKDLGISLNNIYSTERKEFPFRNKNYKLEDIFLNEYKIGPDNDIKPNQVLILKNTLDNSKIHKYDNNEQYILKNYKKLKIEGKSIIAGLFNWIFAKQKQP